MNSREQAICNRQAAIARLTMEAETEAVSMVARRLESEMRKAVTIIGRHPGTVVVTGTQRSVELARRLAEELRANRTDARFVHPNQAVRGQLGDYTPGDPVVILAVEGAALELLPLVAWLRYLHSPIVAIISSGGPMLAGEVDSLLDASAVLGPGPQSPSSTSRSVVVTSLSEALVVGVLQERRRPSVMSARPVMPSAEEHDRSFILVAA